MVRERRENAFETPSMGDNLQIVVQAPVNIALIKYWGKRDEALMLPLNDSISLSINALWAKTSIMVGPHISEHSVTINGRVLKWPEECGRFAKVFREIRHLVNERNGCINTRRKSYPRHSNDAFPKHWHIKIVSTTNFPIAAGLASSAAGFAAIAFGLGQLFNLDEDSVVRLARIGSGSACRSIMSGFVHWHAGSSDFDSSCDSLAPPLYWTELRAVILVTSGFQKKVGSSQGMQNSINTSQLLKTRIEKIVPERVQRLREAIKSKDFETLANITMAESNQLHAICMDTMPPLYYLNEDSQRIIEFVFAFNARFGLKLAYTFDAGPNCCLFMESQTVPLFHACFTQCFSIQCEFLPSIPEQCIESMDHNENGVRNSMVVSQEKNTSNGNELKFPWADKQPLHIIQAIYSEVGTGPLVCVGEKEFMS